MHLDSPRFLTRWAREVPAAAERLAERFWPGPLTLVLPRADNVHPLVTGGQDTVAVRVPAHPMAQQLLTAFGGGIAAPSANRYGRVSPTRAEHVRDEFGDAVRVVLDGGDASSGSNRPSSPAWTAGAAAAPGRDQPVAAAARGRRGADTSRRRRRRACPAVSARTTRRPRRCRSCRAMRSRSWPRRCRRAGSASRCWRSGRRCGTYQFVTWINAGTRPEAYAHDLYAHLRTLDKAGCARILVQAVPGDERWDAVRDRLRARRRGELRRARCRDDDSMAVGVLP